MNKKSPLTIATVAALFSVSAYATYAVVDVAPAGSRSAAANSCSGAAPWGSSTIYRQGDRFTFDGHLYQAKLEIWNAPPDHAAAAAWYDKLGACGGDGDDNQLPTVALTSPLAGATYDAGATVRLSAAASDGDGDVVKVEYHLGNLLLGSSAVPPYAIDWTGVAAGTYTVKAVAIDDKGARAESAAVMIAVGQSGEVPGDSYDPNQSYAAGCVVIHGGLYYRAKFWANPGQSPADVVANPWDTPWERIAPTELGCTGDDSGTPGEPGDPLPIVNIPLSKLLDDEARLTDFPLMRATLHAIRTLPNEQVAAVAPLRPQNPDNVKRVESIFNEQQFEYVFPLRAQEYTYRGLLQAFAKFPAICQTYSDGRDSDLICRKTLATMAAHFAQETGGHDIHSPIPEWRQALVHVREMGWNEGMRGGYNGECNPITWQGKTWPCGHFEDGEFKSYFGRGAKQLSYNYNYGPFSQAMFGTVRTLLDQPELVADTWLNLASATFFFMYPQPPKPSMMHVIDGTWQPNGRDLANGLVPGFGVTTQIINGGVECGGANEHEQSANRIKYYRDAAAYFGVPLPGNEVLGCKGMKQFDEGGAGALPIYWETDHSWVGDQVGGLSYACKLVGYQTPYSALNPGDYAKCVAGNFSNVVIVDDVN